MIQRMPGSLSGILSADSQTAPRSAAACASSRNAASRCHWSTASASARSATVIPSPRSQFFTRGSGVVTAPLDDHVAVELEDLDLLPVFSLADELVAEQARLDHAEIGAARQVALAEDLGGREHGVAGEQRRGVAAGLVDEIAERVVGDVRAAEPEAQHERDAAEDDELPA